MPPQARAMPVLLPFLGFSWVWVCTAMPPQARAVPVFLVKGVKKFLLFRIVFGQKPTKQMKKITQNKKKAIKSVGCLPRSARLESLA